METVTVNQVERSDAADAARALSQAFYDDPVCGHVWPEAGTRLARSERTFAAQIGVLWVRREVHADDRFGSVAVWARPDEWEIPFGAVVRILPSYLRNRVHLSALRAYLGTDKLHPEEPHWYLEYLGTVPERQGKGLGGQVLARGLRLADDEGVPVWTWSSNRRNLAFYHRHGFEVLDELPFSPGGPPIFPIRREPR